MRILSPINENKDIVNKEYVDNHSGENAFHWYNGLGWYALSGLSSLDGAIISYQGMDMALSEAFWMLYTYAPDDANIGTIAEIILTQATIPSELVLSANCLAFSVDFPNKLSMTFEIQSSNNAYSISSFSVESYGVSNRHFKYTATMQSGAPVIQIIYEGQSKLVSGTSIKTINNQSLLGSGNINISGSFYDYDDSQTPDDIPYNYAGVNSFDGININNQDISVVGLVYSLLQFPLSHLESLSSYIAQYAAALYVPTANFIPNADNALTIIIPGYGVAQFPLVLDNDHYKADGVTFLSYRYGFAALFTSNGVTTAYDVLSKQDQLVSGTNIKTINNQSLLGSGNISISGGSSTDVQINGTSIVDNDVANILTQTAYNASSNKIATMSDLPIDFFDTGVTIPRDADLNDYTTIGKYYSSSASAAQSLSNCPTTVNFVMFVIKRTSDISQIILDLYGHIYTRHATSAGLPDEWRTVPYDIRINNSSILSGGIANFVTNTAYDSSTNKIATMSDVPTDTNDLTNGAGFITGITSSDVTTALGYTPYDSTNPNGYTSNTGTITGITMNGASKGTSGVVDLGTVITSHQDISGKLDTSKVKNAQSTTAGDVYDVRYINTEKQDKLVSGTSIKTINNESILGSGNISISGGASTDVQINGTSIVSNNVANILTNSAYNASSNKLATMSDVPSVSDRLKIYARSGYNLNTCYDAGVYLVAQGSNIPSGSNYGSLLVMPYRQATGNTTPDFGTQIFMPNGDDNTHPNSFYYRTALSGSWNSWQELETTTNKVTSISSSSTDAQYPSAKCVYDIIGDIESLLGGI